MTEYSLTLVDIESMIPWERAVFLSLMKNHIKKKNELRQRAMEDLRD
jgi:hypothetical protein